MAAGLSTMSLGARLLLAAIPAAVALVLMLLDVRVFHWPGPYMWHPEFIDVLFALCVLAPCIPGTGNKWPRIAGLIAASVAIHQLAVSAALHSQWPLEPWLTWRFASLVPVVVTASLALGYALRWIAPLKLSFAAVMRLAIAGGIGGVAFLLSYQLLPWDSEELFLLPWLVWYSSLAWAVHPGQRRPGPRGH